MKEETDVKLGRRSKLNFNDLRYGDYIEVVKTFNMDNDGSKKKHYSFKGYLIKKTTGFIPSRYLDNDCCFTLAMKYRGVLIKRVFNFFDKNISLVKIIKPNVSKSVQKRFIRKL